MLINNTLFTVVTILIPILIFFGLSIFVKRKFDSYYGVFFGMILSAFGFGAFQASSGKIYIIDSDLSPSAYRVFGDFDAEFENNKTQSISIPQGKTVVINNSNTSIVIDEIIYGTDGYFKNKSAWKEIINDIDSTYTSPNTSSNSFLIESDSYEILNIKKNTIDFFFDENIPETMEEYGVHGNITKYWLHKI